MWHSQRKKLGYPLGDNQEGQRPTEAEGNGSEKHGKVGQLQFSVKYKVLKTHNDK